jgi:hypothetical protein
MPVVVVATLLACAPAASALTWSGEGTSSNTAWSNTANWVEGTAPSGTVGMLSFPALTDPACAVIPSSTKACYESTDDVAGLTANTLMLDDGDDYFLMATALNVLTLSPATPGGVALQGSETADHGLPTIQLPLMLAADQQWSIDGGASGEGAVEFDDAITGSSSLAIDLPRDGTAFFEGSAQVGAVTVGSTGEIGLGTQTMANASLNGTDGNPVTLNGASLVSGLGDNAIGPLTNNGGRIQIGRPDNAHGTLAADGGVTLGSGSDLVMLMDGGSGVPGGHYTQLSATGAVNLAGSLELSYSTTQLCAPTFHLGDVATLITTTGTLSGTFSGIPNGGVVTVHGCATAAPAEMINYNTSGSPQTVTATVVATPTATALSIAPASPATNQSVTLTATVTPNDAVPAGTVSFADNGAAIAGCSSQPLSLAGGAYTATCQT